MPKLYKLWIPIHRGRINVYPVDICTCSRENNSLTVECRPEQIHGALLWASLVEMKEERYCGCTWSKHPGNNGEVQKVLGYSIPTKETQLGFQHYFAWNENPLSTTYAPDCTLFCRIDVHIHTQVGQCYQGGISSPNTGSAPCKWPRLLNRRK